MSYRGRVIRIWAAGLAMAGIAGLVSPGRAGAQQAAATPPYTFNLYGTINVGKLTDVTLSVRPTGSTPLPAAAKQIQLQAYLPGGKKLVWTKTYANYPFTAGTASFLGLTGLQQGSLLKAQVQIQTAGMTKAQSYSVDGRVYALPDVAIESASAPSQVGQHHPVSVNATIRERKGDLGAAFEVVLLRGNVVLDSTSVTVGPGATWNGDLKTCFRTLGTTTLTVKILKVDPIEFDPSAADNQRDVTITVVDAPLTPSNSHVLSYNNSVSRDLTVVKDLTLGGAVLTDDGKDSNEEAMSYQSQFSSPAPLAGVSVYVVTEGVERISQCIALDAKENPVKDLPDGRTFHSMTSEKFLNPEQTDYLRFECSWETDSLNNVVTPYSGVLTVSHFAATHVYFSAANFFATGSTDPSTRDASGSLWQVRPSLNPPCFVADIRVFSTDGKDYGHHLEQTSLDHTVVDIPVNPNDPDTTVEIDKFGHEIETRNRSHTDTWAIFSQDSN